MSIMVERSGGPWEAFLAQASSMRTGRERIAQKPVMSIKPVQNSGGAQSSTLEHAPHSQQFDTLRHAANGLLKEAGQEAAPVAVIDQWQEQAGAGASYRLQVLSHGTLHTQSGAIGQPAKRMVAQAPDKPIEINTKPALIRLQRPFGNQAVLITQVGVFDVGVALEPIPSLEQISVQTHGDDVEIGFGGGDSLTIKKPASDIPLVLHLGGGTSFRVGSTGLLPPGFSLDARA